MAEQLKLARETEAALDAIVLALNEIVHDTTWLTTRYGDGVTPGGVLIPTGAMISNQNFVYGTVAGTANTPVITLLRVPTVLVAGLSIMWRAAFTNTGSMTITLQDIVPGTTHSVIPLRKGVPTVELEADDVVAGRTYQAVYDGSSFVLWPDPTEFVGPWKKEKSYTYVDEAEEWVIDLPDPGSVDYRFTMRSVSHRFATPDNLMMALEIDSTWTANEVLITDAIGSSLAPNEVGENAEFRLWQVPGNKGPKIVTGTSGGNNSTALNTIFAKFTETGTVTKVRFQYSNSAVYKFKDGKIFVQGRD